MNNDTYVVSDEFRMPFTVVLFPSHCFYSQLKVEVIPTYRSPGGSMSQAVGSNSSYKPIPNTAWVAPSFVNYKKGALDSQPQVIKFTSYLPRVGGFFPGSPASSTTKTGRHDIAEILLKVTLDTKIQIQIQIF